MSITGHQGQRLLLAQAVRPAAGEGQDRVAVVRVGDAVVLAVADGSGGTSGGAEAADRSIRLVTDEAYLHRMEDERAWAKLFARIDADADHQSGQCALVSAAVHQDVITGASGDCGAWLIRDDIEDLTEQQVRKPLVGSGSAVPVEFRRALGGGTLLLALTGCSSLPAGRTSHESRSAKTSTPQRRNCSSCPNFAPATSRTT